MRQDGTRIESSSRHLNPEFQKIRFDGGFSWPTKIRSVLSQLLWRGDFCGGDRSGGMTTALPRAKSAARIILNSLIDLTGANLRGVAPDLPSALRAMPKPVRDRFVNVASCVLSPSNLAQIETWEYLESETERPGSMLVYLCSI